MKKVFLIVAMGAMAMGAMAQGAARVEQGAARMVPPRDPNRWAEYERVMEEQRLADSLAMAEDETEGPAIEEGEAVGMRRQPRRLPPARTFTPRVLVIMAQFNDWSFVTSRADVDSMFNGENWAKDNAKGSVRKYFYDQSNGVYNPQFDIVGPVTLNSSYTAYPGSSNGATLAKDACTLVNDSVDFTQYDADGNGTIDLVFVYYAGFGQNDPPDGTEFPTVNSNKLIWPHYSTASARNGFDGKTLGAYECANELDGWYSTAKQNVIAGIGVLVHEYCHGLGIPDMYSTAKPTTTHKTLGLWSVMDYGPYADDMHSPSCLTAYERWYLGWLTPEHLTTNGSYSLAALSTNNEAYYLTEDNRAVSNILAPNPGTFYLVENRQQTGWDRGLPGHGMLVTKVQYVSSKWLGNIVNNDVTAMGVDILEADGQAPSYVANSNNGWYGKQGDCYPYNSQNATISNSTLTLADIEESQGVVTFTVTGGEEPGPATLEPAIDSEKKAQKIMRNGQILILRGDDMYTIFGQKTK